MKVAITREEKYANKQQWFKDNTDRLIAKHSSLGSDSKGIDIETKMQVNYDLFNNILNIDELQYVVAPFGLKVGKMPARMQNRDIISGKIKTLVEMDMKKAFSWSVISTNPTVLQHKLRKTFDEIKKSVYGEIQREVRVDIEKEQAEKNQGRKLSSQEMEALQKQIEAEIPMRTPAAAKKFVTEKYKAPVEEMDYQILQYLYRSKDLKTKFNTVFKHGLISSREIGYVSSLGEDPDVWVVNPMQFRASYGEDEVFIEKAEEIVCQYNMTNTQIIKLFGSKMKESDIKDLLENEEVLPEDYIWNTRLNEQGTHTVYHTLWRAPRKVGFLTYKDENGEEQLDIVDETYTLKDDDIKLEWEYLDEIYETWRVKDIYLEMKELDNQFEDAYAVTENDMPYYGVIYDNLNSDSTSLVDRLVYYQYLLNIVVYRIEMLMASDKGKKLLMNIALVPKKEGIDLKKWQYYAEASPYIWYDPKEEGKNYNDANTVAKVLDMSLASDIQQYIEIAEFIKRQASESTGISRQMEGQIAQRDAVANTQQSIVQSSYIIGGYFSLHQKMKKNILNGLLKTAKSIYRKSNRTLLSYVTDDLTQEIIKLDISLLHNNTTGIYIEDEGDTTEIINMIRNYTQAALNSQQLNLSDAISTLRTKSIRQIEGELKLAEEKKRNEAIELEKQKQEGAKQAAQLIEEGKDRQLDRDKELFEFEEKLRRETMREKTLLEGASFNPDTDKNDNGVNDFIEQAKKVQQMNLDIKKDKREDERLELDKKKQKLAEKVATQKQNTKNSDKK